LFSTKEEMPGAPWSVEMTVALLFVVSVIALFSSSTSYAQTQSARRNASAFESPAASYPSIFQYGWASWYESGRVTASGEPFRPDALTAAHRTLPLGSRVKVVHARAGRAVVVRINDRGPFVRGRVLDLSRGAARALGVSGVANVSVHGVED
jgi:rare lipoprotein A